MKGHYRRNDGWGGDETSASFSVIYWVKIATDKIFLLTIYSPPSIPSKGHRTSKWMLEVVGVLFLTKGVANDNSKRKSLSVVRPWRVALVALFVHVCFSENRRFAPSYSKKIQDAYTTV